MMTAEQKAELARLQELAARETSAELAEVTQRHGAMQGAMGILANGGLVPGAKDRADVIAVVKGALETVTGEVLAALRALPEGATHAPSMSQVAGGLWKRMHELSK